MVSINCIKTSFFGGWSNRALAVLRPFKFINQQQSFKSNDCKDLEIQCGDRFKQKPCDPRQLKIILKQPAPKPLPLEKRTINVQMPKECCGDICPDAYPRFDAVYYKRTDKLNRKYQQTWSECPELIRKPKTICCFDKIKPPKWKKRPRQQRPLTACQQSCSLLNAKCPYMTMSGCRQAAHPPRCRFLTKKSICKKRKVPFPAYSECSRKMRKPKHPAECHCLLRPSICEAWSYYHYIQTFKKPSLC